jgi:hypothetical protein
MRLTDKLRRRSVAGVTEAVVGFQHGRCLICDDVLGQDEPIAIDHVFPFALMRRVGVLGWHGPDLDAVWNLTPAHTSCNTAKGAAPPSDEQMRRLATPRSCDCHTPPDDIGPRTPRRQPRSAHPCGSSSSPKSTAASGREPAKRPDMNHLLDSAPRASGLFAVRSFRTRLSLFDISSSAASCRVARSPPRFTRHKSRENRPPVHQHRTRHLAPPNHVAFSPTTMING